MLFISDIRTGYTEDHVQKDMAAQMRWHLIIKPKKSILKFRLPWDDGKTLYLDGKIHLPVWGPITTTEARLITSGDKMKLYDNKDYEERMYYFNTVLRTKLYKHNIKMDGIDFCYDCAAEIKIIKEYIRKYGGYRVEEMIKLIDKACSNYKTLANLTKK